MPINLSMRTAVKTRLNNFQVIECTDGKPASVALIISEAGFGASIPGMPYFDSWQSDASLLLTRRAANLSRHARQWALPGGRVDAGESLLETAIRETKEEIGLSLRTSDYLGRLDDYKTRTGYVMSGLVFWGGKAEKLQPSPDEVESIHRIPFSELLREDAPILDYDEITSDEKESGTNHPTLRMPIGSDWIAAPTAALLYQFREVCLANRQTRVGHFEQPRFAWK